MTDKNDNIRGYLYCVSRSCKDCTLYEEYFDKSHCFLGRVGDFSLHYLGKTHTHYALARSWDYVMDNMNILYCFNYDAPIYEDDSYTLGEVLRDFLKENKK